MKPNTAGTPHFVRLSAQATTAQLRNEVYQGQPVVAIPVVALRGNIVVEGMNSEEPEFVPSDVLAAAPNGLDGRPCVNVHPADGKEGANTPERWENAVFGQCFGSHFTNDALQTEVWLNRAQAEHVGPDAVEVIDKALAHEMFEVSIGAWVWLEDEEGIAPDGNHYGQRWKAAVFDHIALGLQAQGGVGACGVDRGCGGPRVLSAKQAIEIKERTDMEPMLARLVAKLGKDGLAALAEGMSDNTLRQKLNKALRAVVPAFWGVEEVFNESSTAIYVAMPGDSIEFWECSFSVDGENVTLGRRKRVEPVTEWKKVAASASAADDLSQLSDEEVAARAANLKTNCKCQDHGAANAAGDQAAPNQGTKGASMTDKIKELVGRLTANAATKLTDADAEALGALGEEKLEAMVALVEKPAEVKEVVKEPTPDPNLVTFTKDEATAMRKALAKQEADEKAHRSTLVKALVGANVKYTEAQLNAKTTDDLEALAETVGVFEIEGGAPDFSGRGLFAAHAAADADGADDFIPPDAYALPAAQATALGYKARTQ